MAAEQGRQFRARQAPGELHRVVQPQRVDLRAQSGAEGLVMDPARKGQPGLFQPRARA